MENKFVPSHSLSLLVALLLLAPFCVSAQEPVHEGPLPPEVQAHVLELANREQSLRLTGRSRIPEGSRIEGDVVVLGGSLHLGGEIRGELVVANGDLFLDSGAVVQGPVWVLGGRVEGRDRARLAGDLQVYRAPLRYRIRDDRVEGAVREGEVPSRFLSTDLGFGQTRLTVRAAGAYNRVEGLPVQFGPVVETSGRNPLVLEAFGIWRSAGGLALDTDDMGYHFGLDQAVGGRGTASVGAEVYSRVRAIESRGLADVESSLATFLMRRDYRDHYEAEGWTGYLRITPARLPLQFRLGFREEAHAFAPVADPWSLGGDDDPWRPQPLVAQGTGRYLETEVEWDSRDDPVHATDGWWLRVAATGQVAGDLRREVVPAVPEEEDAATFPRVLWGSADVRRYARVSPSTHLRLRVFLAGSPLRRELPPQFQSALGGEGSLPGHRRFAVDCQARSLTFASPDDEDASVFGGYGCDDVSLVQVELQRMLPFEWNPFPEEWEGSELPGLVRIQPALTVFLNAGQGWARSEDESDGRRNSPQMADVGVGLVAGSLGFYWAHPLNRRDRGLNFFVRLQHRF